ncbi:unnamed protein product [Cylicocyclus nassatus]|uniref:RING-type E3 ubiquitin transferase (cysteine targeting) n=1 Tax=Cylicocyclus nassatus TaxID=53992 RepID=A0AA36H5G6_CYLNA|nr:unnamed protein product [Cylicocyclus nassatus]
MACESLRIEQVDANFLDREYKQIIEQQFAELTIGLPVSISRICDYLKPEIRLLVDSVLWTTRVYRGASPGQLTMNIAYKDYPIRKVFTHFLISVFIPYVHGRFFNAVNSGVIRKFLSKLSAVYEAFCILHYLNFLRVGGHSTLVESYLNLRNWNNDLPTVGTINYESQNRELLWHTRGAVE